MDADKRIRIFLGLGLALAMFAMSDSTKADDVDFQLSKHSFFREKVNQQPKA